MTNKQKRFFNIAREVSLLSDFKRARIGAVVVEGNRVVSTGCNSTKTSPVQDKYNRYAERSDRMISELGYELSKIKSAKDFEKFAKKNKLYEG